MSDPFTFTSTTPRLGLPNLFTAQAQKEMTVNEAFALIDALLHPVVEGMANDPPASPVEGECWIVNGQPTGDWANDAGKIACRQAGNWLFATPTNGMVVFDKSVSQNIRYDSGWTSASAVTLPTGGGTVDVEARAAISEVVAALEAAGILAGS